jgi:uncharacterized integral membrane protein
VTDKAPDKPVRRWVRRVRYAVLTALIVLPLIIFFQNLDTSVAAGVLFWKPTMPVILLLGIAFVGGGTAGLWLGLALRKRRRQ